MTRTEYQAALLEIACQLGQQERRLDAIARSLRLPEENLDAMLELEVPGTVELEVFSRIQSLKDDVFGPGIRALIAAARLDDEELRQQFASARRRLAEDHEDI